MNPMTLTAEILAHALSLGFDLAATMPVASRATARRFTAWLQAGHHGEMAYLAERAALRLAPARLLDGAHHDCAGCELQSGPAAARLG